MTLQNRIIASVIFLFGIVVLILLSGFAFSGAENDFMRHTIQSALTAVAFIATLLTIVNLRSQLITPLNSIHEYAVKIQKGNFNAHLEGTFNFEFKDLHDSLTGIVGNFKEQVTHAQEANERIKISEEQSHRALSAAKEQDEKVQKMLISMRDVASRAHGLSSNAFNAVHELSSQN